MKVWDGRFILISTFIALAGCSAGQVNKDFKFDSDNSKGLMVLGWEGLDKYYTAQIELYFQGVDKDGKFDDRAIRITNGDTFERKNPTEYYVVEAKPGYYVIDYAITHPIITKITRLCLGTIKFEILPGKVSYVGNIHSTLNGPPVQAAFPHPDAAAAKLSEYPKITPPMTLSPIWNVPYPDKTLCH
ncbi:MAG: hypothetical protein PW843_21370 [Azospirillaceae bacterium]|nr:hypothetical protein [Azospirillaceae bacterium]